MYMSARILFIIVATLSASFASADDKAPITFSGSGKGPVEVKDSSGEVSEVVTQKDLTLNQIPADAVARERAYREQQNELARGFEAERADEQRAIAAAEAEAAKAEEEAAAKAAAEAQAAEEEFDNTPRKVRRKTVRGTRYVANEPVDPSLRTPDNSGIRQVEPTQSGAGPSWPPARPTQQLPDEKPQKQYDPN
jgi:hypothetical protein